MQALQPSSDIEVSATAVLRFIFLYLVFWNLFCIGFGVIIPYYNIPLRV